MYYGCYNIEQCIPKELYIDYRNFKNDNELSQYLINFPKDKYIEMVEKAYEYYLKMKLEFKEDAVNLKNLLIKLQ